MAGPRIDLAALERRAHAAQIAVVEHARPTGVVPAPAGLQDVPHDLASSRDFLAAKTAVERWSAATALYQRANALYHHPTIRQAVGDEATLRWLWDHPAEAQQFLVAASVEEPTRGLFRDGRPPPRAPGRPLFQPGAG